MNPVIKTSVIVILLSETAIHLPSCTKEASLPNVATIPVTNTTQTSALAGASLSDDGAANMPMKWLYTGVQRTLFEL